MKRAPKPELESASASETELIDQIATTAEAPARIEGLVVGWIADRRDGETWVDYPDNPTGGPLRARAAALPDDCPPHAEVALAFDGGHPDRPFVVGPMATAKARPPLRLIEEDGRQVLDVDGDFEIRCGTARIVMTRDGEIHIRGNYVLTRAEGTNRILGGSVRIN